MTGVRFRHAIASAMIAFSLYSCTTTGGSGASGVSGPQVKAVAGGSVQGTAATEISTKAKLLFEDASKDFEAQKKAHAYNYPLLERKFRAAAEADHRLAEADYNLGVIAERQGKTKEASAHYRDALSKKPTLRQAAENLAVMAQNSGDEAGAVRIYEDILTKYPDDAASRARLAEIHRRRGENDRALELARDALFRDHKTIQAYKTMMHVYTDQKQYSLARLIALRAMKLDDADPEIYYTTGLINLAENEPIKAKVQFKKAVEARPDFLPAHYQLVKMAFAQGNYMSAEEHLRKILQAGGSNPAVLLNLGVAYKGMGQLDRAMQSYDEAQKLNSEMPELYLNRGVIIGIKGDPEKAITMFKAYISKKGGDTGVPYDHPVHALIEEQEKVIRQREEDKRLTEEAKRVEEEMKKQEAATADEDKVKKDGELKQRQLDAKGKGEGAKTAPSPAAETSGDKPPPVAPRREAASKKEAPPPAPAPTPRKEAPKPAASDEPEDGL
jgi:tetratricopeptide (TPR) repeat protein